MLLKDAPAAVVTADKTYDAHARLSEPLQQAGKSVVTPPRRTAREPQRVCDRDLYKARHLIENFSARLEQYRSIATRYALRQDCAQLPGCNPLGRSCNLAYLMTRLHLRSTFCLSSS